jgi:transcriptional coactivator HFI1/ADA1
MLPISYESGLPSGHTAECASLVNLATEVYIKEALSNFFTRVSSNGPGYVRTAEFKRRIEREEEKVMRGELGRGAAGLLPGEVEEMRKRRPLCMEDLRLALHLGDPFLGHVPIMSSQILNETFLDTHGIEDVVGGERVGGVGGHGHGFSLHQSNGLANGLSSGYHFDLNEPAVAEDEWSWAGGSVQDLDSLDAVLDGCLAVGL